MNIWLVDLEAVETRYTKQWKIELPKILKKNNHTVKIISGGESPQATTPGAFLNFGGTNVYKSKQLEIIGLAFCNGEVQDGDYFLYTDAWNPTVIQLKYMAELLNVKIKIGGMWHAGSYDPQDFLGRLIGDKPWVRYAEKSMFECFDHNYFATNFHIDMFLNNLLDKEAVVNNSKIVRCGWPMEYLKDTLYDYKNSSKENIILFPHRLAPEKQLDIFLDLKKTMPQYEFIVCQDKQLDKHQYHTLLGKSKMVFSANLQETLGISWYEGALVNCIPMVPNRLSYEEMALDEFKYPTEWTESLESYHTHKKLIIEKITNYIEHYESYLPSLEKQKEILSKEYFSATNLYNSLSA
jgi:glycosyltransferase involved in cell wall biosynthesis